MVPRMKLPTSTDAPGVEKKFWEDHVLRSQSATLFGGVSLSYSIFCSNEHMCDMASMNDVDRVSALRYFLVFSHRVLNVAFRCPFGVVRVPVR